MFADVSAPHTLSLPPRLKRARLNLDLLLGVRRIRFLVADVRPDSQQRAAAVDGLQEAPRLFGYLARVGAWRGCGEELLVSAN